MMATSITFANNCIWRMYLVSGQRKYPPELDVGKSNGLALQHSALHIHSREASALLVRPLQHVAALSRVCLPCPH